MPDLTLNPLQTALVLIDLQKGIVSRPGAPHSMAAVVSNGARLAARFRELGSPVVSVRVTPSADGKDFLNLPADTPSNFNLSALPPGWNEFVPELNAQPGDLVITKRQWGAFYGTELDLQLRRRGVSTIVLGGVSTNIGVESTARSAAEHGNRRWACAGEHGGAKVRPNAGYGHRCFVDPHGAGLIAFSFSRTIWLSFLLMAVAGFGMMASYTASSTVIQTIVDEDKRGRATSLDDGLYGRQSDRQSRRRRASAYSRRPPARLSFAEQGALRAGSGFGCDSPSCGRPCAPSTSAWAYCRPDRNRVALSATES